MIPIYLRSTPNFDTLATLMYNSSQENVETTIVGGRIVYHKNSLPVAWRKRLWRLRLIVRPKSSWPACKTG